MKLSDVSLIQLAGVPFHFKTVFQSAFFLLFQPKEKKIVPGFCQLVSITNLRIEKFFLEAKLFGARAEERERVKS